MGLRWVQQHPIECAAAVLLLIAVGAILIDFLQYRGYYLHNYWTEKAWSDDSDFNHRAGWRMPKGKTDAGTGPCAPAETESDDEKNEGMHGPAPAAGSPDESHQR